MLNNIFKKIPKTLSRQFLSQFSSKITIKLPPFKFHRLPEDSIPLEIQTDKEELLFIYERMQTMRRLELACDMLFKSAELKGFCHLYDGSEAVVTGIEQVLNFEDCLITAYRCHCHQLTRGDTPVQILAEMLAKKEGSTKGKGGSMHLYRKKNNFYGGNGIVGAQTSVGTGLAFALKYEKKPNVCVTMFGDGAANQGQLAESMNMAQLWKLPVLYICENNHYAMGTETQRAASNENFYARGDMIPGLCVDGMNIFSMKQAISFAKKFSIENGPLYIEADTYRYHGHSMSDPGLSYRTREEVQEVRISRDPINFVKKIIFENKIQTEDEIKKIDRRVKQLIDQAADQARKSTNCTKDDLFTDIYVNNDQFYVRDVEYQTSQFPNGVKY